MFDSPIFDVAIGLALIYLVLSLIVTSITQVISEALAIKAGQLKKSIATLLGETARAVKSGKAPGLIEEFYNSPFVMHFRKPGSDGKRAEPSEIDSKSFLPALEHAIEQKFGIENLTEVLDFAAKVKNKAPEAAGALKKLEETPAAEAFLKTDIGKTLASYYQRADREVESGLTTVKNSAVRFEQHVEDWYDSATDKAWTWYRTHLRKISFGVALIVVLAFNADTLRISGSIWNSEEKQTVISAMADKYVEETSLTPGGADGSAGMDATVDQLEERLDTFNAVIEEGDLPIGWHIESVHAFFVHGKIAVNNLKWAEVVSALLGWLVTTFALSLGAPFWYDTLKRVIQVRQTVKQTEKSLAQPKAA